MSTIIAFLLLILLMFLLTIHYQPVIHSYAPPLTDCLGAQSLFMAMFISYVVVIAFGILLKFVGVEFPI